MKRIFIVIGGVVLILLITAGIMGAGFAKWSPIADGQEIYGARIVQDGGTSFIIIPTGEKEVLLVDAGQDVQGKALLAELTRRQLGTEAVKAVLITHGHPDHIGGTKVLPHAEIIALAAEVPIVEGRERSHGPATRFMQAPAGIKVTRALHDGEAFMIGTASIQVFAMPGHTQGSAAYLVNNVLFVGDSLGISKQGEVIPAPWIFADSQADNRASLKRLAQRLTEQKIDVHAIVPAHSGIAQGFTALQEFAHNDE